MLSKTIVKYIQSLAHKKLRDEHGVFIAEGPKVIVDFLTENEFASKDIYALQDWLNESKDLLKNIPEKNIHAISEIELEKISLLQTPNKVVGLFYKKENRLDDLKNNFSLMLDELQDPGNMGTIIRTADWFGVKNIICSHGCVDCYNPKVVQGSMGSLGRVNIIYTDLEDFLKTNPDIKTYAATLNGTDVTSLQKIRAGIIVIGNESKGISDRILQISSEKITIPKQGKAESLNAGVACGIILSHLV